MKGYRLIRNADIVFLPINRSKSFAGEIVKDYLTDKKTVEIEFPMGKVDGKRYEEAADTIDSRLEDGETGVFLTLGDPMVYSTFSYLMAELEKIGIRVESVPGISSFQAAANRIRLPLACKGQNFYLTDGEIDEEVLRHVDTVAILKAGKDKEKLLDLLESRGFAYSYIRRCGCPEETILYNKEEILKEEDYMSLILGRRRKHDSFCGSGSGRCGSDNGKGQKTD